MQQSYENTQNKLSLINQHLAQLNIVFNRIEPYQNDANIGFRSLKNIGVWLILYAMADKYTQKDICGELSVVLEFAESDLLKNSLSFLSQVDSIKTIIHDYENAGGTFTMEVSPEVLPEFQNQCNALDPSGELAKYIIGNPELADDSIGLTMENRIKFFWAGSYNMPVECELSKNTFKGKETQYLTAKDHGATDKTQRFNYKLINQDNQYYHAVEFRVLQESDSGFSSGSKAYFIEPFKQANLHHLSSQYFNIIETLTTSDNFDDKTYAELKKLMHDHKLDNISIKEKLPKEIDVKPTDFNVPTIYNFHFKVNFPKLAEKLATTEHRLGIYSVFQGKNIANVHDMVLKYNGIRELSYDEKSGGIYNKEEIRGESACMYRRNPRKIIDVYIEYTLSNEFMFVYGANNKSDFYPFKVSDPQHNLVNEFKADGNYQPYEGEMIPLKEIVQNHSQNRNGFHAPKAANKTPDYQKDTSCVLQ